jgi:MFS family permease
VSAADAGAADRPAPGRDVALASAVMGVSFVAQSMLALAVPLYALHLGASVATVGLLVSLPFWLPTLVAIPIGRVVSRVGARRTMLVGAVGMTLAPWLTVMSPGMLGLVATQLLLGITQVTMGVAAQSTVAGAGRGRALERAFGWYTTSVSSGQLVGPLLAGFVIDRFGGPTVFALAGTVTTACIVAASRLSPSQRSPAGPRRSLLGYRDQVHLVRANVGVQMALVVTLAMLFGFSSHSAFFPVYLEHLAVPATLIGLLVSVRAVCSTVVRPFVPLVVRVLGGRSRTITLCIVTIALAVLFTGVTHHLAALTLLAAGLGLAVGVAQPLAMVAVADHVETGDRPAALGFRLTINQATQVVSPLLLGAVAHAAGMSMMFVIGGGVLLAIALAVQRLRPGFDRLERAVASASEAAG